MAVVAPRVQGLAGAVQAGGLVRCLERGCRLGLDPRRYPRLRLRLRCRRGRSRNRSRLRCVRMPVE